MKTAWQVLVGFRCSASLLLALMLAGLADCRGSNRQSQASELSQPAVGAPVMQGATAVSGFAADEPEETNAYVRRTYRRGGERVTVTLAQFPMTAEQYQEWVRMSTDYPQADLGLAQQGDGNGFYQCAADNPSRCNLLIQLRSGTHIEIRGEGKPALRADADTLARTWVTLRR